MRQIERKKNRKSFGVIILSCLFLLSGIAAAEKNKPLVKAELISDRLTVTPGEKFRLGVILKIPPGSHTYWMNPGEAGLAPEIQWHLPPGFQDGPLFWPLPQKIEETGGLTVNAYTEEVLLFCWVYPPANLESQAVTIKADLNWLVCSRACVREEAELELRLPMGGQKICSLSNQELFEKYSIKIPRPADQVKGIKVNAYWEKQAGTEREIRTGVILLEAEQKDASWLPDTWQYLWFDYPSDIIGTEEFSVAAGEGRSSRVKISLKVRKFEQNPEWPLDWGGVLKATLVDTAGDTVSYALSVIFSD